MNHIKPFKDFITESNNINANTPDQLKNYLINTIEKYFNTKEKDFNIKPTNNLEGTGYTLSKKDIEL